MEETFLWTNQLPGYLLLIGVKVLALVNDLLLKVLVRKYLRYSCNNIIFTHQLLYSSRLLLANRGNPTQTSLAKLLRQIPSTNGIYRLT